MRVVDTSAWIEWLLGSSVGEALQPQLPPAGEWLVPTIVQLELFKWYSRERSEEEAEWVIARSQRLIVVPLDDAIAVEAAKLCLDHKLSTSDAVIYATARLQDSDLLTCDAHFEGLPGVIYVSNKAH